MRLGLIPPNSMLSFLDETNFQLLLPWQMDKIPEASLQRPEVFRVLDNGAAEGPTYSLNALANLVRKYKFDEVVAPDKMKDCEASIAGVKSMGPFKDQFPGIRVMGVLQGESIAELMKCLNAYRYSGLVDTIGLPRVLNHQHGRHFRLTFLDTVLNDSEWEGLTIHCLGAMYTFPEEIKYIAEYSQVRSMDSSVPFVYGLRGKTFDDRWHPNWVRPDNYFDYDVKPSDWEVCEDNVRRYIKWAEAS